MHVQDLALSCTPSHGGIGSINKYNTAHSNLASVCLVKKLVRIVVPMIGLLLDGVFCFVLFCFVCLATLGVPVVA
jgi:hypothetical protein